LIEKLYLLICRIWGDEPLPKQPYPAWPQKRILSVRTWSQYFLTGNIIRLGIWMPMLWVALMHGIYAILYIIWFPLLVHVLFVMVELHKLIIIKRTLHQAPEGEWHDRPRRRANFKDLNAKVLGLKGFESVGFYRAIGVYHYHKFVMWYIGKALRGGSPQYLERTGPRYALDYAMEALHAEKVHAIAATLNTTMTIMILPCWWALPAPTYVMTEMHISTTLLMEIGRGVILWQAYWLFMEWYLVLVQRFIRVRILSALTKKAPVT